LKNGQTIFRDGEIIDLSLAFSSSAPGKYTRDTRNYDRSGRMMAEVFCIEPTAGRDPLDDYFNSGIAGGFIGGGIGGFEKLAATPSVVEIQLNEWKLLPPGRYRLRLMSGRIARSAAAGESGSGTIQVPLWSNSVEFEIVTAAADWQASQLAAARGALDSGADDAGKRSGARTLRFLDTEAAARELATRFSGLNSQPFGWEFMFGLMGSSHRQTAIEAMKAAILDPSHPVTREFITTLALLEIQSNPDYRLPPFNSVDKDTWTKLRERKVAAYERAISAHFTEVAATIDARTGSGRAITLDGLLAAPPGVIDSEYLRKMVIASWESLPLRTRNDFIQFRWDEIAGPEMLPILRNIVDSTPPRGRPPNQPDRGPALARLYELAPDEGRALMLREMVAPRSEISMATLGRLPDRELPEIEQPILARLKSGDGWEADFLLLDRYGTTAPLKDLQRIYEAGRGRWACAPQTAMLRYFLRVDRGYGVTQVGDALTHRDVTGCYTGLFSDLKDALSIPEVEALAITALEDPSPEVVRYAAEALGRFGSASVEALLWARLEKFHATWKDRYDELRTGPGLSSAHAADNMVEYALMNALSRGDAWICGPDKLERLRSVISPARQYEVTGRLASWQTGQFPIVLSWSSDRRIYFDVASYSGDSIERLARKLQQFPRGSRFTLPLRADIADRHLSELETLRAAAAGAGLELEIIKR